MFRQFVSFDNGICGIENLASSFYNMYSKGADLII